MQREPALGCSPIREWTEGRHVPGHVLPSTLLLCATASLRRELGYHPDAPLIVASVGGSAVGIHLLRRIAAAFDLLRASKPDAELLIVCGPRIDPAQFAGLPGVRAVGYVHDPSRTLACCDLAVVQGGLSTTMELSRKPPSFIYLPLRNHWSRTSTSRTGCAATARRRRPTTTTRPGAAGAADGGTTQDAWSTHQQRQAARRGRRVSSRC